MAFVEADVIVIRGVDDWRQKISAATGIPKDCILLGDEHNHAAPSPSSKLETKLGATVRERIADRGDASRGLAPTSAPGCRDRAFSRGHEPPQSAPADVDSFLTFDENERSQFFGRFKTDQPANIHDFGGVVRLGANPAGPMDDAVQIVRVDTAGGKPLAVMIHYACHGTSLGGRNGKISGEWMGRMQEYVEQQFPGVGAIYLKGAAGD